MKIAIDVHSLGARAGGNETYFQQLVQGLARYSGGHQYTLLYTKSGAPKTVGDLGGAFEWARISDGPLLRNLWSLPKTVRQKQARVFHFQYIRPPWVAAKTVVTIHDLAFERFPEFFHPVERLRMKIFVRETAKRVDHILVPSHAAARDVEQLYGVPKEKITAARLAASEMFAPRNKEQAQELVASKYGVQSPFILYVGRVQARKNLVRLVEAYAKARERGVLAKLVIIGKRDWRSEQLEARTREMGMAGSVVLLGYVPIDDLPQFYNAAQFFVFPSVFEGFGLPVIESMASGLPTLTSYGSSLEEVAGDGALLVDPLSVESIAKGLVRLHEDRELRERLVERGLAQSAKFKFGELALKALKVYESLG